MSGRHLDLILDIADPRWEAALPDAETILRQAIALALTDVPDSDRSIEIGARLVDDAAIRNLNRDWRGKDKPTNVLSFPLGDPDPLPASSAGPTLPWLAGDIVMAYETVAAEAEREGKPLAHHVAHLAVHATLHLLGHDHEDEPEAKAMEAAEIALLARLDIPDPYADRSNGLALTNDLGIES